MRAFAFALARGTQSPVGHLSFIDLVAIVIRCRQAGSRADRTVDVNDTAARTTDQVVVVVVHPVLVASRRTDGLNPSENALIDQDAQCVVDGLARNRAEFELREFGHFVGRDVGADRHRPQHRDALGGCLKTVVAKLFGRALGHACRLVQTLDRVKKWS